MRGEIRLLLAMLLLGGITLAGCQTTAPDLAALANVVGPEPEEQIRVTEAIIVVDASGSMVCCEFPYAKELTRSFVSGMPEGYYEAGMLAYGSEWTYDWLQAAPRTFDRQALLSTASHLRWIGGSTPLGQALLSLKDDLTDAPSRAALIIFSDGKADRASTLDACTQLKTAHLGSLCIHTVQLGCDAGGQQLLADMAALGNGCGTARQADTVATQEGMEDFVHDVFFGPLLDSDGDGVPDVRDECPDTPPGAKVDHRGCWVLDTVLFDTDKAVIRPQYAGVLDEVAQVLNENPGINVRVDGHTDSRADNAYNQKLSKKRAVAVRKALVERGIGAKRLGTKAFGETRPAVANDTAAHMQFNRRVELTVVQ